MWFYYNVRYNVFKQMKCIRGKPLLYTWLTQGTKYRTNFTRLPINVLHVLCERRDKNIKT